MLAVASFAAVVALGLQLRRLGYVVGVVRPPTLAPFVRQKTILLATYRRDGAPVNIVVDGDQAVIRSFREGG